MRAKSLVQVFLLVILVSLAGAVSAHADYTPKNYNATVRGVGGYGYSDYAQKSSTDDPGRIFSRTVGGHYLVDARMQSASGTTAGARWVRIDDGTVASLTNWFVAGTRVRIQFHNDLSTLVRVQVTGSWYEA